MTGGSEQISDAVAHQATADYADFLLCVFVHFFLEQINGRNRADT
jgi:hypothetical protein